MSSRMRRLVANAIFAAALLVARSGFAQDTIKIGYIDPLSGAFAQQGDASLRHFAYLLDRINAEGGALGKKFEIVSYDSKLQPAEALIALNSVIDQNISFVMQCAGSCQRVRRQSHRV